MSTHHVVILGAGSAALAAARTLAAHPQISTTLVAQTGEQPYTRMLIKGIAFGDTAPEAIRARLPRVEFVTDTAVSVDAAGRAVRLASGAALPFDSLIVATGSRARALDEAVRGAVEAARAGQLVTLHGMGDAMHIAARLRATPERIPVAIYGAGLTASETASSLRSLGHPVALISRSELPGVASFGGAIAGRIADAHRANVDTYFGRTVDAIRSGSESAVVALDDGTELEVALLIVAVGTEPHAPAPWDGGVSVDGGLRVLDGGIAQGGDSGGGVFAAGGVAIHRGGPLGDWRIDHWDDASEQGSHAARGVLSALGLGEDPGVYLPRSAHLAMIYGHTVAGAGFTGTPEARPAGAEGGVYLHERGGLVVGASGLDAVGPVYQWAQLLHGADA